MGFNRTPHYARGVLLVGDAGGMVNPFNGEGIPYAMESGELAADVVVQALARHGEARERVLHSYPPALRTRGAGTTVGRVFVKLIGNPDVMKLATRHGLPPPTLMKFVLKLLATSRTPPTATSWTGSSTALSRMAPAA